MIPNACAREDEILDALGRGFVGPELEAHLTGCEACRDLRIVAGSLLDDRIAATKEAAVPSAGTMWWRMQLRARHEAAAAARRTLLVGQAASLMVALMLVAAFFGGDVLSAAMQAVATVRVSTPLLLLIGAWLLLVPIGGWVALRQK